MAKSKRSGLPADFDIGATRDDLDDDEGPIQIGDYLEETMAPPVRREPPVKRPAPPPKVAPEAPREAPPAKPRGQEPVAEPTPAVLPFAERPVVDVQPQPAARQAGAASLRPQKPARVQVNLSVEAKRAHEAIMDFVQARARQRDTKHTEVYQALILALEEALPHLDLKSVPERGAWGTPTARSFVSALKGAFIEAIGELHSAERSQP